MPVLDYHSQRSHDSDKPHPSRKPAVISFLLALLSLGTAALLMIQSHEDSWFTRVNATTLAQCTFFAPPLLALASLAVAVPHAWRRKSPLATLAIFASLASLGLYTFLKVPKWLII